MKTIHKIKPERSKSGQGLSYKNPKTKLQGQVLRQAPNRNIPIGGMLKGLGKVSGPVMTIGVPVGQFVNETAQWNPVNLERYKQGVQIPQRGVGLAPNPYKDYYIEPSRKR